MQEARKYGAKEATVVVVGNKTDLANRAVTESEAAAWADSHGYRYFETSANSDVGVADMFETLFDLTFRRNKT